MKDRGTFKCWKKTGVACSACCVLTVALFGQNVTLNTIVSFNNGSKPYGTQTFVNKGCGTKRSGT